MREWHLEGSAIDGRTQNEVHLAFQSVGHEVGAQSTTNKILKNLHLHPDNYFPVWVLFFNPLRHASLMAKLVIEVLYQVMSKRKFNHLNNHQDNL